MATYVMLVNFTDQGVKTAKDSPQRAETFKQMAKKLGATVRDVLWTLGQYDIVTTIDAPDDATITALGLSVAGLGNVRTQTMWAFSEAEIKTILGKMA